jgi:hypothetical protein
MRQVKLFTATQGSALEIVTNEFLEELVKKKYQLKGVVYKNPSRDCFSAFILFDDDRPVDFMKNRTGALPYKTEAPSSITSNRDLIGDDELPF